MGKRLSSTDGQRIWRTLQRFAEYNDLKELYQRCIPEIAKFEQRIIDFQGSIDRFNEIIRHFDESLIHKVDKALLQQLKVDLQEVYVSK